MTTSDELLGCIEEWAERLYPIPDVDAAIDAAMRESARKDSHD